MLIDMAQVGVKDPRPLTASDSIMMQEGGRALVLESAADP